MLCLKYFQRNLFSQHKHSHHLSLHLDVNIFFHRFETLDFILEPFESVVEDSSIVGCFDEKIW